MTGHVSGVGYRIGGLVRITLVMMMVAALFAIAPPAHAAATVAIASGSAAEGASVDFVVTLSEDPVLVVEVDYATSDGSATLADSDYSVTAGTLTFNPGGSLTQAISVPTGDDSKDEDNEQFSVTLSNPVNTSVSGTNPATGTINDNDNAPTVSIGNGSATEGTPVSFTVTLAAASGKVVEVDYATSDGSATLADSDYSATSGTLTFNPGGSLTQAISVPTGNDSKDEDNEQFSVTLSSPVNTSVSGTNPATGTINDNDNAPTVSIGNGSATEGTPVSFTVTLAAASGNVVSVSYATSDGSATLADSDYSATSGTLTFNPGGSLTQAISVPTGNDSKDEDNEQFSVTLSSPVNTSVSGGPGTGTINDNDNAPTVSIGNGSAVEGAAVSFSVTLAAASGKVVSVSYATSDGSATLADSDYSATSGTLTFNPGGSLTQAISVPTGNDSKDEDDEQFSVTLSSPVNTSVSGGPGTGTINDNDNAPTISVNSVQVEEGLTAEFTVTLSAASSRTVTVSRRTANGTAAAPGDYTALLPASLTFIPGELTKNVNVVTVEDPMNEAAETFTLVLSGPTNATIAPPPGTGTILNDDGPPGLSALDATPAAEGSAGLVFNVSLLPASGQTVRVNYATADGTAKAATDYTATTGFVEFAPGETIKPVTVPITNDTTDEITEALVLNLSVSVNAAIADAQAVGSILDNDNVKPSITSLEALDQANNPTFQFGTGDTVKLRASFTDPGIADAHSVTLNWGDGTAPTTFPMTPVGARSFERTHTFAAEGFYQISVSVADGDGGSGSDDYFITVSGPGVGVTDDTMGLVDPTRGVWRLYSELGVAVTEFYYGNPGDYPFMGDWDGDGISTPGLYRQSDGYVYLRNSNTQGVGEIKFFFGNPGDVPIAGDFNNDGFDTVSIYRPSNQTFYIINKLGSGDAGLGAAEFSYVFGNPGDKPFTGDFDGDGIDTAGLHRESTGLVYFRNSHTQGNADHQFIYGDPGDQLVAGDWTGDGIDSPTIYRSSDQTIYIRYTNTQGHANATWSAGVSGWIPVAGVTGTG